ncbi:hypothetical protein K431DRAFT_224155 [Polychaeton citri CBS 116435]|uniref:Cyclin-domain-containing protein n=1 Tax=Polychaeton citri CBS 116435 TaxID=1314669 RepID=A0A9P4UMM7_9PEZI|nr:hypothetical protein K431DRAFT_224155 [Polychaeton citri CBS 116435]
MEDGDTSGRNGSRPGSGANTPIRRTPPPPPNPHVGPNAGDIDLVYRDKNDEPLVLENGDWNIWDISGLCALRMLMYALEQLAEATGDVPPTPPVTRPTTPERRKSNGKEDLSSLSPTCDAKLYPIGSPEAHPHEPVLLTHDAPEHHIQHAAIARRFFSRVAPPFTLSDYLLRFHQYCPHSPGVYLAAAAFCHKLCVRDYLVPATNRTIHRLSLAAIRIAAKSLEDNKWSQERCAKVGGINPTQLLNLEITLLFLLDFELGVTEKDVANSMFLLQQAARQKLGASKLQGFKMRLPLRRKANRPSIIN